MSSRVRMRFSLVVVGRCSVLKPHKQNATTCISLPKGSTAHSLFLSIVSISLFREYSCLVYPLWSKVMHQTLNWLKLHWGGAIIGWCCRILYLERQIKEKCFMIVFANFNLHWSSGEFFHAGNVVAQKNPTIRLSHSSHADNNGCWRYILNVQYKKLLYFNLIFCDWCSLHLPINTNLKRSYRIYDSHKWNTWCGLPSSS